jgi:hypothetical protein
MMHFFVPAWAISSSFTVALGEKNHECWTFILPRPPPHTVSSYRVSQGIAKSLETNTYSIIVLRELGSRFFLFVGTAYFEVLSEEHRQMKNFLIFQN